MHLMMNRNGSHGDVVHEYMLLLPRICCIFLGRVICSWDGTSTLHYLNLMVACPPYVAEKGT